MDKYNNLDNSSFKDVYKNDYKSGSASTATAASAAGSGTASTGTASATGGSHVREYLALRKRFTQWSLWDTPEEVKRMSADERRTMFTLMQGDLHEHASKELSEDELFDLAEKLFLICPDEMLHVATIMLGQIIGRHMFKEKDNPSEQQFIDSVPGQFGQTCSRTRKEFLGYLELLETDVGITASTLGKMRECQKELMRNLQFAKAVNRQAERVIEIPTWKSRAKDTEIVLKFANAIKGFFDIVIKELERLEPLFQSSIEIIDKGLKAKSATSSSSSQAAPAKPAKDSRLVELDKMSPDEVRKKMIGDASYREKSGVLLRMGRSDMSKGDMNMFEKLLFLGLAGDELEDALEKVKTSLSDSPKGWLGSKIKDLQGKMNKAPTVSSGWGILGGLIVIALFVALAVFLYMEPAVAAFMVGATELVLAIGMIVCFLLGMAGGFIGGVLAALAWGVVTFLINELIPIEKALHIIVCILALAPSLFGLGWIFTSTPSARRKDQKAREKHIIDCRKEGEELIEYINDVLVAISPEANTTNGQKAQRYYQSAVEKIRRIKPM